MQVGEFNQWTLQKPPQKNESKISMPDFAIQGKTMTDNEEEIELMVIAVQTITVAQLMTSVSDLFIECLGDTSRVFTQVASPENATPQSLVFLATPKSIAAGVKSPALIWVVGRKAKEAAVAAATAGQTIVVVKNVERAMAQTIHTFFLQTPYTNRAIQGIHPTAIIAESAKLGLDVRVGPNVFIGQHVCVGERVYIGANSVIEDQSTIGDECVIHPLVFIGHSTLIGKRCEVHPSSVIGKEGYGYAHDELGNHYRIPHQGRVVLEDDVHIGSKNTIDRGTFGETRLRAGAKLDNKIHIAHNCDIGENSLITSGFGIAGSSKIGANFITGGNSSVGGHLDVCANVHLAGESSISKSVSVPGQYGGYPTQPLQKYIKTKVAILHLVEMQKQLKLVLKHLGLESKVSEPLSAVRGQTDVATDQ